MVSSSVSVVVAGGGTAGHIEPALAVADAIRAADPEARVTALGTPKGLEGTLVPARGYELRMIPPVPLPRKPNADLAKLPFRLAGTVRRTRAVLRDVGADVVVGFGGYVALPAYLAARSMGIPIVIHEANASAGIANKVGARLATKVFAAVADSGVAAEVVGIPVRTAITGLDRAALRAQARAHFGLPADGPVVLVFGGSQGAVRLNEGVAGAARDFADAGIGVLHAYGPKNSVEVDVPGYVAVPYLSRMDLAYAAADLAVCRSGAMTVAEVAAVGLPAVYVPLPIGNGEQSLNARPVVAADGGLLVEDAAFTAAFVRDTVIPLAADPARLAAMGAAAAGTGHRDAAGTVAASALDLGGRR
ncbi:UDP-N-acetylglucosamine--N-acetylmuramyl-(pentapeptide) pyrophosphoryl-undecaprenol N-acetylglucosamine transferase OS=Tsukamurella paurometabola (strain ATCC 8368 / DSM / CCUG 35730 / CIP 100753 / JCM 10117 / KCTC 9821 / NBRC 16120 / NCIMB 702349 / NCTC 13040) OX=521096 GN=murG PE=3 SV=1 [Tsukamurella paurometabola]|uniref:UDP-N-acetylglucosamine--N-acetylmuramyl-(pentapeptide) pyrophosphoryl-undecaprenol N-acetylglucosamine transferase n=1 Tax=Tsukamurella paurometabola (strain ATCC 8368 / DSM 20162 / CCUG 35730 / CIP 100753 / JCM 10117 / KCTC 9821 / NBRC 16120 / NCIMB 702349 / NCTC 13040) TaxID=521096 RepID=D5USH5_TSUPD|nr:undecaprenyldiphospho-muramoylpentapeptide beta-N-acetylglucosaminyltransferase [Tsukamurella paurometabola]ADG79246.1 UDP-N-acetylglucosamine--N-acetylmuramyl- (pentapeptide) pyrophosphoryl-undecaprenol N- acetylglucosamine transferase [Tsukamurella paurometabola DSM 20162]SUP34743.1 UDP-N-acetylglucosamine--N-acetylmuramyl-(pentapeptide) pyrophosphoryl-undecaprenol N-acetylglucosamine transferase [Tsukamurella paurometabola]